MDLMLDSIDPSELKRLLRECVEVDSPVSYYPEIHAWLGDTLAEMGYEMYTDSRRCAYVRVPGADSSKTVLLGAHLDTIGLIVRGFNDDGTLRVRQLGGINYHSIEGETCSILCRDGSAIAGQVICEKHSVHVFEDARTETRDENHMFVSVIGDVKSADDARALGITEGAIIGIDPHYEEFDNGYIVSRHIDDKAAVAVLLDVLAWLKSSGQKPAFDTVFAFPINEEIGQGGAWVPRDVDEYVAVDITLVGPDYNSDEHSVGIIASDAKGPYDWELTNTLIACAEEACFHYSTDANAGFNNANDLTCAAFGMACMNTHGRERCHVDAIVETEKLARAYVMGIGR